MIMQYWILLGLGVWFQEKAIMYSYPDQDLTFTLEIINFLMTIFLWPFNLGGHFLQSRRMRQFQLEVTAELQKALASGSSVSLTAPESSRNDEQPKDGAQGS